MPRFASASTLRLRRANQRLASNAGAISLATVIGLALLAISATGLALASSRATCAPIPSLDTLTSIMRNGHDLPAPIIAPMR